MSIKDIGAVPSIDSAGSMPGSPPIAVDASRPATFSSLIL